MYQFLIVTLLLQLNLAFAGDEACIDIRHSQCDKLGYNTTIFPNLFNHESFSEAKDSFQHMDYILNLDCGRYARHFFCNVYFPMCSPAKKYFPPCRELCKETKRSCLPNLQLLNKEWPKKLECEQFPQKTDNQLCYGPEIKEKCKTSIEFTCPADMKTPKLYKNHYMFMGEEHCGAPCDNNRLLFWTSNQRQFASIWIGCLSMLCAVSTFFTVLTYLIDMKRFHYPERPIVFLSVCYLGVSVAYISGFILKDNVACQRFHTAHSCPDDPIEQCPKVVTQGAQEAGCTILFMMVYFFSMAGSIWWIVLSLTWFMSAGLKWGHEAIEEKSSYFHGAAWAVPAVQTIIVLVTSKIEGDVLSGVCFVGVYNSEDLQNFLLIPLSIYLLIGLVFLVAGFYSMYNIRNQVRSDAGTHKVYKLERLMVKIGVFSVLYTVPATVVIACYFYEFFNRGSWQRGWVANNCEFYTIPCPCEYNVDKDSTPNFVVFVLKYSMMMIVGITSGFWIWSAKTVESWTSFKDRVLCNRQQRSTQQQQQHINHSLVGARYHRATPSGSDSSRQHQQQQQVVGAGGAMSYDAHQQMPLYIPSAQHRGGGL